MTNPFEDETSAYLVLVNDEGQHSLWPVFAAVPDGWTEVYRGASKAESLAYVEANWTDLRPKSLIAAMESRPETSSSSATQSS